MNAIWKFEIQVQDRQTIQMPAGAHILTAQAQYDCICLWAEVEATNHLVNRHFEVIGTGSPVMDGFGDYVATVQLPPYVWHVYEV